ncbi:MAG: dienelactone hydrolase family protein [Gemmatimonadetes bacterium]|nr:dienelactone hydrolase family protein [Gemmatimonadota bacterium]
MKDRTSLPRPRRSPRRRSGVAALHAYRCAALLAGGGLLFFVGCAEPADDIPDEELTSAAQEARVALDPTADGELPPAIVGQGGPLGGVPLQYMNGDTLTTGYLAVPEGAGPFPALVIIHEWNGLVDRVRQVADDFAAEGYVTLAADLYQGRTGSNPDENIALVQETQADMPAVIANLDAAVAYLRSRPDVTGRVGAMGWCFGGGIALSFGLDGENHEATAIFYGRLVDDPDVLAGMDHEVYGTFARLDGGPSPEQVEAFEAAMNSAGVDHDLHIYDDVDHGFWLRVDGAPERRTEPALDAWQRLKAYLGRTLGG